MLAERGSRAHRPNVVADASRQRQLDRPLGTDPGGVEERHSRVAVVDQEPDLGAAGDDAPQSTRLAMTTR
jgi:hypothetical protein